MVCHFAPGPERELPAIASGWNSRWTEGLVQTCCNSDRYVPLRRCRHTDRHVVMSTVPFTA